MRTRKTTVLIVDDSTFIRRALRRILNADPQLEVVGEARDGEEAVAAVATLRPDVVTLDVRMPRLDGVGALRQIMDTHPTAVVMVSSITSQGGATTLAALEAGAVDFIDKSSCHTMMDVFALGETLVEKVRVAAGVDMRRVGARTHTTPDFACVTSPGPGVPRSPPPCAVCIAASTGGPVALHDVLTSLPADYPGAVLVVQHMPEGFTQSFAERLNALCALPVREAEQGDRVEAGQALIAPSGCHMILQQGTDGCRIGLTRQDFGYSHRPAADVLMRSVAETWDRPALGVILTGMGRDGTLGAAAFKQRGWPVVAQDEASCVVFGMPKSAADAGYVDRLVPLADISATIVTYPAQLPRDRA